MTTQIAEQIQIWRDGNGVPHVVARDRASLYWGQGFVHATDRALQMLLMRIVGQGRVSEILEASQAALELDVFFRRMNWADAESVVEESLSVESRAFLDQYCAGVNAALQKRRPWEFRLLRYRPEPWRPADTLLIMRMLGYVTLQQSQVEMERLLVELVQAGASPEQLEELYPGLLAGLDVDLLKRVRLPNRLIPVSLLGAALPRLMASNNWVLSGAKSKSGKPLLANDPHLEGNRLPNVWCEVALQAEGRYLIGASIPGGPGIAIGRNPDVAWGATYAFMDCADSWVEQCREGRYFREPDQWVPFSQRRELIRRKRQPAAEITIYENEHGVLDGDPYQDEYCLATRWTGARSGAVSLEQILRMWDVQSVAEGQETLGRIETCWNFVLADRHGNIGYQMSGLMPKRREGIRGLVPLPGWKRENDWQGHVSHVDLPRCLNPASGFFMTANQDLNCYGNVRPINLPMGSYRADRIQQLLTETPVLGCEDIFRMHFDVYSPQAALFLEILRPLLPETRQGELLRHWDCRYTADSQGAFLFEEFYKRLSRRVFGGPGCGERAIEHLAQTTGIFADFYLNFDRVLLSEQSIWFAGQTREELYRAAVADALSLEPRAWGEVQQYLMQHLLLGGKLPQWLGFDRGPITAEGGRATIHQGQVYRSGERLTTFVPSFRLVIDLATDEVRSNLQGGPSDRRFSRWYCSDLPNWREGKYKTVRLDPAQSRLRFP